MTKFPNLSRNTLFAMVLAATLIAGVTVSFESQASCSGTGYCRESACGGCCCDSLDRWFILPQKKSGLNFSGWMDAGIIGNTSSPNSKFNGPYNAVDRSNEAMMNQLYLVAEKDLPKCGVGLGMRFDMLYGEDFFLAESIGMEKRPDGSPHWNGEYYGVALPQAYVTLGNERTSLQMGHFYSVVGYEGVMAPDNFFYSKSYSYQFAGPFTHWGAQVNWKPSNRWNVQMGVHNGWDALDRVSDKVGFVGKVRYDSTRTGLWTSFAIVTGEESNNLAGLPIVDDYTNRTRYSWLVGLPLTCRLDYVFHHWLGFQDDGAVGGRRADWYGVDQYLYYTLNRCWKAGFRFEYFRDEEGTRIGLNRARNPNNPPFAGNVYSFAFGMNWTPTNNLVVRPEFRTDWYDGNAVPLPFNDGAKDTQTMFGIDAILLF